MLTMQGDSAMDKTKTIEISQEVYDKLKERADECDTTADALAEELIEDGLNDW